MRANKSLLKAKLAFHDHTQKEIAKKLGISENTFGIKLRTGKFKLDEIHKMIVIIPLTVSDVIEIFFAEQ